MKLMRSSKRRAIEKLDEDVTKKSEPSSSDGGHHHHHHHQTLPFGSCSPGKCKGETACRSFPNNTYTCVCTHSSLPPTASGKCARNVVNVGAVIPILQKIPVQPPPEDQEATPTILKSISSVTDIPIPINENKVSFHLESFLIFGIISTIIIFLFGVLIYYFRRKTKRRSNTASPINLKQSLLIPERYAPNPHYSACCSTDVPVIRKETLEFLDELGEGCFGKVFKGELTRSPEVKPDIVAIKVLKETASKEAEEDFFREVEIMSTFRHPNILSFIGVVLREGTSCGLINPMMVFEYMEHGDLAEVLRSQNSCSASSSNQNYGLEHIVVQSIDLLNAAFQIASGMEYLAAQRFVHRDLACRNCLVAEGPTVKIADFGMSRDVYTCDYYKTGGSRLLPVRWMSPESVVYGRFTLESDIWSYGVVLWEIFSYGKQPYYGHTNEEVVKLILDGIMLIPPEDSPPFICELMKNCWKTEPKHRITFSTIKVMLEEAFYNKTVEMKEQLASLSSVASSRNEIFSQTPNINKRSLPSRITDQKLKSLPRPPPLPRTISDTDLLDSDGYLQPNVVKEPALYLQTLPSD